MVKRVRGEINKSTRSFPLRRGGRPDNGCPDSLCAPHPGCVALCPQAQGFHGEIEDMQQWLKDTERQLLASKAVGGLPDSAREQLNVHLVGL